MSRLMVNDPTKTNPLALINVEKIAALADVVAPTAEYLRALGEDMISVAENIVFTVGGSIYKTRGTTTLSVANLDAGVNFVVGSDYYIYVCDDGSDSEVYKISLNSTYPAGYNDQNSRKIGGFHFGRCRRVDTILRPINASSAPYGSGWESNAYDGILPRSVWTLRHRPKCSPEGMVYVGNGLWVDIYLSSSDGANGLRSMFNGIPLTGTEGYNWYSFVDRAMLAGKRLLTYDEFCRAAYGSPQGNDGDNVNAWTKTTNTGRNPAGNIANAVSSIGCRDCVGDVWEWTGTMFLRGSHDIISGAGTYASYDGSRAGKAYTNGNGHGVSGTWNWDTMSPLGDTTGGNPNNGNIHQYYDYGLVALLAGGNWAGGSHAGARAVTLYHWAWLVITDVGARCACESL